MDYVIETLLIGRLLGITGSEDDILTKIEGLKYS
jgi:hypothetical protein